MQDATFKSKSDPLPQSQLEANMAQFVFYMSKKNNKKKQPPFFFLNDITLHLDNVFLYKTRYIWIEFIAIKNYLGKGWLAGLKSVGEECTK